MQRGLQPLVCKTKLNHFWPLRYGQQFVLVVLNLNVNFFQRLTSIQSPPQWGQYKLIFVGIFSNWNKKNTNISQFVISVAIGIIEKRLSWILVLIPDQWVCRSHCPVKFGKPEFYERMADIWLTYGKCLISPFFIFSRRLVINLRLLGLSGWRT